MPAVAAGVDSADRQPVPEYLTFGFLPIVSSERLVRRFSPLTRYLSEAMGIEVRMETAPDFAEFIRRTAEERRYDILFTAPHLYYVAHRDSGYQAVARVSRDSMKAVIVTPKSGDIHSVEDLRGRRLATTDRLALVTVLVRSLLLHAGLDPDHDLTLIPTPSHNASLLASYRGIADASALIKPLYLRAPEDIRNEMKIIAETQSVPHMPISVAPWVDAQTADRLREALVSLSHTRQGREVLQKSGMPGFRATQGTEYTNLRNIVEQDGTQ